MTMVRSVRLVFFISLSLSHGSEYKAMETLPKERLSPEQGHIWNKNTPSVSMACLRRLALTQPQTHVQSLPDFCQGFFDNVCKIFRNASCTVLKKLCGNTTSLDTEMSTAPPSKVGIQGEDACNSVINLRKQCTHNSDECNCQVNISCDNSRCVTYTCTPGNATCDNDLKRSLQESCECVLNTSNSTSPSTTITSAPSGSGTNAESSSSTDSTSPTPTTPSTSTPNPESSALTESMTSSLASAAGDSSVEVAVISCLAVLFVVVVVVAVFFWRRKRQPNGVSKENNSICCSLATTLQHKQDSLHVYDKLSYENKRVNIDNASTGAANSPDNDNNDDYTYIDGPAINKGVVRLHQDRPVTTAGEHALTDPSVSGLHSDLPSTYRLARVTDNDAPDSLPPDYFILEERDEKGCPEPTQYFILEEMGEKKSAADTDSQQYFILEETQEGAGRESIPQRLFSRSEADYFELENDDGQEPECADLARSDASREEAEYCRLDPNSCQESEYTLLSRPPQPPDTIGDNPYCLASYPE